jgi:hypothetical protein
MSASRRIPATGYLGKDAQRHNGIPLPRDPHLPAPYDDYDLASIQACANGTADSGQQVRALQWIVFAAGAGTFDWAYVPGDPVATNIALGKQRVGKEVLKLVNLKAQGDDSGEQG